MTVVLDARGISARRGRSVVIEDAGVSVDEGQIAVIVGPNGAGKTSLFDCISGFGQVASGSVVHRGQEVTGWTPDRLARRGLVRTFQRSSVFASMSVADNLRTAAEKQRRRGLLRGLAGFGDPLHERAAAIVGEVLVEFGLTSYADVRAGTLPSGTLRLVEVARALAAGPDVVLLDEPAAGLDSRQTEQFHAVLRRLAGRGLAVLMIEHDLALVRAAADVVHVMHAGRVIAAGPPGDVLGRPDVRALLTGAPA
jgi:branched-chain amino acid transport system ATP-binding protein